MGNQNSLTAKQIEECRMDSDFTEEEVQEIFKKFKKLDKEHKGVLTGEKIIAAIPELTNNPLVDRVVATFDENKTGDVDFMEFIHSMSIFATAHEDGENMRGGDRKEKLYKFTFKLYDVDGDGYISNADLFHVLKAMVGKNLNDKQLQQLVDRTMRQGDKDIDGKLNYAEFVEMIKNEDLQSKLHIELFKDAKR